MNVLKQFEQRFQLGPSLKEDKGWDIQVDERYSIQCLTNGSHVCLNAEIGALGDTRDPDVALHETLQNLTIKLPEVKETVYLADDKICLNRNLGKPGNLAIMEQALEEFISSLEFFQAIYGRHI